MTTAIANRTSVVTISSIRTMVNDAARVMGTRLPHVEPDGDAL